MSRAERAEALGFDAESLAHFEQRLELLANLIQKEVLAQGAQADLIMELIVTGQYTIGFDSIADFAAHYRRQKRWVYEMMQLGEERLRLRELCNGLHWERLPVTIRQARVTHQLGEHAGPVWEAGVKEDSPEAVRDHRLVEIAMAMGVWPHASGKKRQRKTGNRTKAAEDADTGGWLPPGASITRIVAFLDLNTDEDEQRQLAETLEQQLAPRNEVREDLPVIDRDADGGLVPPLSVTDGEAEPVPTPPRPPPGPEADELRIEELDFSIHTFNCLKRDGIQTLAELVRKTEDDLMNIRNFSRKCRLEVQVKLAERGLFLAVPSEEVVDELDDRMAALLVAAVEYEVAIQGGASRLMGEGMVKLEALMTAAIAYGQALREARVREAGE
jgi:hypothetical protein